MQTQTVVLRKELREKGIQLTVVKNSLARRATEGTVLAPAFEGLEGTLAAVWGAEDFVSLAKEVVRLHDSKLRLRSVRSPWRSHGWRGNFRRLESKKLANGPVELSNSASSPVKFLAQVRNCLRN